MRMRHRWTLALLLPLLSAAGAVAQDVKKLETTEYYPLSVGTTWTYSTGEGTMTTKVAKHEEIGGVMCARIEATTADKKTTSEYVHVSEDGVYRHQASEQSITPPLLFLKLPVKDGASWKVDVKVAGKKLAGSYTMSVEEVTLKNGKKYSDVVVCQSDDFEIDGQQLPHTYYFAKDIGIVKQVVSFAGEEVVMELDKFEPGE